MNKRVRALALGLAATGLAAVATPGLGGVEGLWLTPTDHGRIRIEDCGGKLCGRLVTSDRLNAFPDQRDVRNHDATLRGRPLKGVLIVQDFVGGPKIWSGGRLYDASAGGVYEGKIRLTGPDTLQLTGCIVYPLCRTQIWTRIPN